MVLVTGAAGKTGQAVIAALKGSGEAVRALVHRPEQVQPVRDLGADDALAGDMTDLPTMAEAAHGVRAIYHICPAVDPREADIGQVAIEAALAAGVEHFVYHSVLHPQIEAMPHHWQKLLVEQHLIASGLAHTILQPTVYMQNLLDTWEPMARQGRYPIPYSTETRLSMVHLGDVADCAATVLTEPGHTGATYELCGPEVLTPIQISGIIGRHLGRPVMPEPMPVGLWAERARAAGLGDYQVQTLATMFRYYERHGLRGNPNVLAWLLGHRPTDFAGFLRKCVPG
jgi:NAD(P)H dehydrogenase (quinone)